MRFLSLTGCLRSNPYRVSVLVLPLGYVKSCSNFDPSCTKRIKDATMQSIQIHAANRIRVTLSVLNNRSGVALRVLLKGRACHTTHSI
jgi:hypothetical protein